MDYLTMALILAFVCVGIALVVVLIQVYKLLRTANTMVADIKVKLDPMMDDAGGMLSDVRPVAAKVDPMVDRVQLTLDAVNLELMRVDEIMEDISQITDTASSATTAVDNIANVPAKAVSNVTAKVRTALGAKSASEESTQLGGQHEAVARALEDYKSAQALEADKGNDGDFEPNFDGFEKMVSDSEPATLENAPEASESADEQAEAGESAAEPTAYFTYDEAESK